MENRTTAIIATVASVVLCGLPGLCLCLFGALTAAGLMNGESTFNGITQTGTVPTTWGFVMLCAALLLILIPVVVAFLTLRRKPAPPVMPPNEPIPPAI